MLQILKRKNIADDGLNEVAGFRDEREEADYTILSFCLGLNKYSSRLQAAEECAMCVHKKRDALDETGNTLVLLCEWIGR